MYYGIGLDIGIASVGSAVMMLDEDGNPQKIIKMSSRIFDAAENPKDGSSLALPRRENRSMRRRLRRKAFRKYRVRELVKNKFVVTDDDIAQIYAEKELADIYKIRCSALDRRLKREEFIRLLIHLSQRRGFKSNRKVDSDDKKSDAGKLLTAVNENEKLMEDNGYRTVGEMLFKDKKFAECKRNKSEGYSNTFSRKDYENEVRCIFECQRSFGNDLADDELEKRFLDIMLSQRSFDEGPDKPSQYGGNQIEKMIGKCTLEKDEPRAVKACDTFERFNFLSKLNAVKIIGSGSGRSLSEAEREAVRTLAYSKSKLTYANIRKELGIGYDKGFNISYGEKDPDEVQKKTAFSYLKAYHTFKKAYGGAYDTWSTEKRNALAWVLTVYKNDEKIRDFLTQNGFSQDEIAVALTLPSFSKTGNLSVKAMEKIIPLLEQGLVYNEACAAAGYNFKADGKSVRRYLPQNAEDAPELGDVVNPVVRRSVSQTIKVINAIVREMGESPVYVNIELARELSKNHDERGKIEKAQNENRANNERLMEEITKTFNHPNPTGLDLVKYKLWKEQDGRCLYSLKAIDVNRLFEPGYVDVDHIVPYSISFDDSYNNKVLVLTEENRQKGNRLPLGYLTGERADNFRVYVENAKLKGRKKKNLLKERVTEDDVSGFKRRNLTDTQYISRFMMNFIKRYLEFTPLEGVGKDTVKSLDGRATDYIRKRWGINKIRENGDTHHAVDAVVIACTTRSMIKRISEYSKRRELENTITNPITLKEARIDTTTGEVIDIGKDRFPMPYRWFRQELEMRCCDNPSRVLSQSPLPNYGTSEQVQPIFVSRMPRHKVTGAAHLETMRKAYIEDGVSYTISKVPLASLKLTKDGEIKNYYNPASDMLLYNALKERLIEFGGKADKAFAEPFYKPKSDGSRGPLVKKVKLMEKATLTVPVLNGNAVAANGSMVRVDVFYVENEGYYLVPVYVSDTVKPELPNKAITPRRAYDDWKVMNDKDFVFSLYPNDLIKVKSKSEMKMSLVNSGSTLAENISSKEFLFYYKGTDISTASFKVINHDNTYFIRGLGVKTLLSIEKYQVDVLGRVSKAGKEKRTGFK